jgi:hypothetical protein
MIGADILPHSLLPGNRFYVPSVLVEVCWCSRNLTQTDGAKNFSPPPGANILLSKH